MLYVGQLDGVHFILEGIMERALGLELRKISNLSRRYFEQYSHKKCIDAITGPNSWIIGYIGDKTEAGEEVYQRDLETRLGITRSTVSKVVNLMVQKGLLERKSVAHDARLKKLVLTEKSMELKKLMDEDHRRFDMALRKGFDQEELTQLFTYLDRMKNNLKELSREEPLG